MNDSYPERRMSAPGSTPDFQLRAQQLDANVDLIRALGGGWIKDDLEPAAAPGQPNMFDKEY